mgnify:FL=1
MSTLTTKKLPAIDTKLTTESGTMSTVYHRFFRNFSEASISVPATPGIVVSTGTAFVARTIAGTGSRIEVTNGNGISGNPTIDLSTSYVGQSSITTLGTITTGVWNGTTLAVGYGGTGASAASITAFNNITGYSAAGATGTTTTNLVFSTSPTLVTPILGTPTSGTLTNCTGYTDANLSTSDITTNNSSTTKHGFCPKLSNVATQYLDGSGAFSVPAGTVAINRVSTQITTVDSTAVVIPIDNTIPQNTEGKEYVTLAITPGNSANILVIEFDSYCSIATAASTVTVALFQDTTADALAAIPCTVPVATYVMPIRLRHIMAAGTTSATTFKIRFGTQNTLDSAYINQGASGALFSTASRSNFSITEYSV